MATPWPTNPPRPHQEPPRGLLLRRRVLPIEEYAAELRGPPTDVARRLHQRFGPGVVPIPVPLAPGESEAQYEDRFLRAYPMVRENATAMVAASERSLRIEFAKKIAKDYRYGRRPLERREDEAGPREPPCDIVKATKIVELDQHRRDYESGVLASYEGLSRTEKKARFGVKVMPIFVPLAPGESKDQYEARFVDWLGRNNLTLAELRADTSSKRERALRIQFADLTMRGELRFEPHHPPGKRGHDALVDSGRDVHVTVASPKRPRRDVESEPLPRCRANGQRSVDARVECGCAACLLGPVTLYMEMISQLESVRRQYAELLESLAIENDSQRVIEADGISSAQADVVNNGFDMSSADTALAEIEDRLQRDFDDINEQIVLNQQALDESLDELVRQQPVDEVEMTRRHEENEEMRRLLEEDCRNRTAVVALLVLYKWRRDHRGLERMVNDKTASDVAHLQRKSYERCMVLANELVSVNQPYTPQEDHIKTEVVAVIKLEESEVDAARKRTEELRRQRRQELTVLVHFDKSLRQSLEDLLRRAEEIQRASR